MANDTLNDVEDLRTIRQALLIGLESFGEIERVIDRFKMLESIGITPDIELRPLHPTGVSDTVGMFASALRALDSMESELQS